MKKVKVLFVAVAEDKIADATELKSPEVHAKNLQEALQKYLPGSKDLAVRVRYARREVLDENDVAETAETLVADEPSGLFECFHCGERAVGWQSDFMFEDYGYEGNGIVQNLICTNCGAEVEYRIPLDDEEGASDE